MDKHFIGRLSWDQYFMQIAKLVASRSTCVRRHVGAVIVNNKHILATGYNGAPSGLKHCSEIGCFREQNNIPSGERHELCRGVHAEQNAIIQIAKHGINNIQGSTLYCTNFPCIICAKMLINVGIKRIVYADSYAEQDSFVLEMLKEANVKIEQIDLKGTSLS